MHEKRHRNIFPEIRNVTRAIPWFFLVWTVSLIYAFFGKVLSGGQQFAFRDGAHFYYPLFRYIRDELRHGRFPLWMPYENLGQPLAANPVAGVFYPLKILFFLPGDFPTAYHLYVVAHVFLAAGTMYRLSRFLRCGVIASTVAATCYAFGGSVLFQHLNVIFLVGAAWFPECMRLMFLKKKYDRICDGISRSSRRLAGGAHVCSRLRNAAQRKRFVSYRLAVVLALIVLGGDVQAAYHAGIVLLCFLGPRRALGTLCLAFFLSAVQVLPSWEFARHGDRAAGATPRSIWDIPRAENFESIKDGLLCRNLDEKGHARTAYLFSTPPWRVVEWFWPNPGGRQFPVNTRWMSATPWDRNLWVPSLYCGVVPALLAFSSLRPFRRKKYRNTSGLPVVFLSRFFLIALAGSFGLFGLGWFVNVFCYGAQGYGVSPSGVGHPVGGVYWLMNLLLPGYAQFRYPAKLLVLAAVPFSLLAASGWDRVFSVTLRHRRGAVAAAAAMIACSFALLLFVAFSAFRRDGVPAVPCDLFGPFVPEAARTGLFDSLCHTIVVLAVFLAVFPVLTFSSRKKTLRRDENSSSAAAPPLFRARKTNRARNVCLAIVLVFLALDLYRANAWLVPSVPQEVFAVRSPLEHLFREERTDAGSSPKPPVRIYRAPLWYPPEFRRRSSEKRFEESVAFDRATLWPKYNLRQRFQVVDVRGTMSLQSYVEYLDALRRDTRTPFEDRLTRLGVRYVIAPSQRRGKPFRLNPRKATLKHLDLKRDFAVWELVDSGLRAWTIRDGNVFPIDEKELKIVRYEPNRIVYETNFSRAQTLVISEQHDPDWNAKLIREDGRVVPVAIFPVEHVFRGMVVPAGRYRLVLDYVPGLLYFGAAISCFAWTFVAARCCSFFFIRAATKPV